MTAAKNLMSIKKRKTTTMLRKWIETQRRVDVQNEREHTKKDIRSKMKL